MNPLRIRTAEVKDAKAIVRLVNVAFRSESRFINGPRTDVEKVEANMKTGDFLVIDDGHALVGCVYVEKRAERGYFGQLAIHPGRQHSGLATRLITEAEDRCRRAGCRFMDLTIVNLRTELPGFYHRLGYAENGTEPFPAPSRAKMPCHLIRMTKPLR
jgi:N-acetylglutamate synthase-like GNAT family acetyltransferase